MMNISPRRLSLGLLLGAVVAAIALVPSRIGAQGAAGQLDATKLRDLIRNMGYEVKDLNTEAGKEKYSFEIKTEKHNVPMGAEISPSKNYIWLTVNLGSTSQYADLPDRSVKLLKQNAAIQPDFFYITSKDNLMLAVAADNRNMGPADFKRLVDKLAKDVDDTATIWSK
jgi:hypothetical protein